jgi:hypothetical protein
MTKRTKTRDPRGGWRIGKDMKKETARVIRRISRKAFQDWRRDRG